MRVCVVSQCLCVLVYMGQYPCFPTLSILGSNETEETKGLIFVLACQGLLVLLNVSPIICLSLSLLFTLFLVSAQWLPLTVSPTTNIAFLSLYLLTLTNLKRPGLVQATWKQQWSFLPGLAPCQWPAVALWAPPSQLIPCIAIVASSVYNQLLLLLGPSPIVPGLPCLILFCKLLSPGSPLITVHGPCKPTQRRRGRGTERHTRRPEWA